MVEPGSFDDLMVEDDVSHGVSATSGSLYCEVFSVHGTGRDQVVASVVGWYRAPGSIEVVAFAAEHPFGVTDVAPLAGGAFDEALDSDTAEVVLTMFPARAFDGLELDALPSIDLAYELSQRLLRTRESSWTIGPSSE